MHVLVPQGIGDIFWVYQLLAPLAPEGGIHFHIAVPASQVHNNPAGLKLAERAFPFVSKWPGVAGVQAHAVTNRDYDRIAKAVLDLDQTVDILTHSTASKPVAFACNGWLEDGRRLETMSATHRPAWSIPLEIAPSTNLTVADLEDGEALGIYISGTSDAEHPRALGAWSVERWVELYHLYCEAFDARQQPVILIGAEYDYAVMQRFQQQAKILRSTFVIQRPPAETYGVMRKMGHFLNFQSGLGILADNLGIHQTMIYFSILERMMETWCQPAHIGGTYHAATFAAKPKDIIRAMEARRATA